MRTGKQRRECSFINVERGSEACEATVVDVCCTPGVMASLRGEWIVYVDAWSCFGGGGGGGSRGEVVQ